MIAWQLPIPRGECSKPATRATLGGLAVGFI